MARILTYEGVFRAGMTVGATLVARTIDHVSQKTASNTPVVTQERQVGLFADDPTWDSFMQSIEEYRNQMDAFERSLE